MMTQDTMVEPTAFKGRTRLQWDEAAAGWDRHGPKIRDWLRVPTDAMLNMAGISRGQTVLDVAAGAGCQTLDIADRVGAAGAVVATDISEGILTYALGNAVRAGHANVRIHPADAEDLGLEDATFDAAICRLGLMFLPHPLAGLGQIHRVLKPGGRFCGMVFAGPEMNPCLRNGYSRIRTAFRGYGLVIHRGHWANKLERQPRNHHGTAFGGAQTAVGPPERGDQAGFRAACRRAKETDRTRAC